MESIINQWLKSRGVAVVVRREKVSGMFTAECIAFRDVKGRNWIIGLVYTDTKILGGLESWSGPMLQGETSVEDIVTSQPYSVLNGLCREVSWENLKGYAPAMPSANDMREWAVKFYSDKVNHLYSVGVGEFVVTEVVVNSDSVLVHYLWRGAVQFPLKLFVGSKNILPARKYGEDSGDYTMFAGKLASVMGEFLWG